MRLVEVVGPTGGNALSVVTAGRDIVVPTEFGVFVRAEQSWRLQPGHGLASVDPSAALQGLVRDGAQMNYPRASLIARHQEALWLVSRVDGEVALLWSNTLGERWSPVELPELQRPSGVEETSAAPPAIQAAEPPRLVTSFRRLYLVGTSDVWLLGGEPTEPTWTSIGLEGLPSGGDGLPPAIRNYLPRADNRPFEVLTVLAEQLLVFRRLARRSVGTDVNDGGRGSRFVGVPRSEAVFLIAPESIQRTDDQGESWFRFWPEGYPQIEAFALVREANDGLGMLVGSVDGSIWRSGDSGATWRQTRPADPDSRAITGLAMRGTEVWASTLGSGVLVSKDGGESWRTSNNGLRAARPLDMAFTTEGEILLATRAGLVQLSGEADSGNWAFIEHRATAAVSVDPISNRTVSGTVHGDLSARAEEGEPVTLPAPFGEQDEFEFSPHRLSGSRLPPDAVVAVNARDDGRRWLAWSRRLGGVKSDDGGQTWSALHLSEGLRAALSATTVRQVVAEPSDTIFLLEENRDARTPALLWRSDDDGRNWTTVHAFGRERASRVIVRPRPPNYPGVLFAAHADQFMRSSDAGSTWTTIDGPWKGNRIIGLAVQENRAALLLDARRRLEVVVVDRLGEGESMSISRHTIVPTQDTTLDPEEVSGFELYERRILVTGRRQLWTGALPEARRALGDGLAFLATLAGALLLIAVAFGIMRASMLSR